MSYEVGYRRPPKSGRFTKGKSGNPNGRPKGSKNFVTLMDKELRQSIVINENGRKKTITRLQAIVKRLVASALQGEQRALRTLVEILQRAGRFEETDAKDLVPDDFEAILEAYVSRRQKASTVKKHV